MSGLGSGRRNATGYSFQNTARLIMSGNEFFNALEALIDNAVREIHFQTYIFDEDETGARIARALIRASERGVKIFLILDAYGSNHLSESFLNKFKNNNIECRLFGQLFRNGRFHIGRRLHRKVVVADGLTSLVSGINISNRYNDLPGQKAWLDFGVEVKGEVSEKLLFICRKNWLRIRYRKLSKGLKQSDRVMNPVVEQVTKIGVRQNDRKIGKNQAAGSYYRLISQAEKTLTIVGGYFLPGRKARRLLKKASDRGVIIKLIVAERSDVGIMRNAMLYLYGWLLRNKIQIHEYIPSNVHGKVIVSDQRNVSIGSYDMNTLSTYSNIELNLVIEDEHFSSALNARIENIIRSDCREISEHLFKSRSGVSGQFLQWLSYRIVKSLFTLSIWLAKKDSKEAYQ